MSSCGSDDGPAGPPPPTSALRFVGLSAGYYHTCGLLGTGSVFCWGANDFGTLGDGTRTLRTLPTLVAGGLSYSALDAGAGHNCALTQAGAAWCWGQNDEGQVGDGTFMLRDRPVAVAAALSFTQISAGHAHSCGVVSNGAAYCWGDDSRGQLGNGMDAVAKSAVPVRVLHTESFSRVVAGYYQTCALSAGGNAYCWGANDSGQLGDGTADDRHVPIPVAGGRAFSDLSPGDRFVCGVSAGITWCWGANRSGELGSSASAGGSSVPLRLEGAPSTTAVFTSTGASTLGSAPYGCVVTAAGAGLCWGGAVGTLRVADPAVTDLDPRIRFQTIAAGAQHICGLSRDGYAYCGGANHGGQLGDGSRVDRPQLVGVHGP